MFKGTTENKQQRKLEGVYVSAYTDKPIRREDVEDRDRPGHAKASLFPAPPDIWNALGHYRLLANGKPTWTVEQAPDPLSPRREEVPGPLLADLERARVAVEAARAKTYAAAVARDLAWLRKKTEWERKRDWPSFQRAEHAEKEAVIRWQEAREDEEREVRRLLLPAEAAIEQWRHFESLRRRQVAYPPSPAPTGPNATIQTVGQPQGPPMITLS